MWANHQWLVLAKNLFNHTLVLWPAIKHVKVPSNTILPYLLLHQICIFHNCCASLAIVFSIIPYNSSLCSNLTCNEKEKQALLSFKAITSPSSRLLPLYVQDFWRWIGIWLDNVGSNWVEVHLGINILLDRKSVV